jgi:hypothetical protein
MGHVFFCFLFGVANCHSHRIEKAKMELVGGLRFITEFELLSFADADTVPRGGLYLLHCYHDPPSVAEHATNKLTTASCINIIPSVLSS